MIPFLSRRRRSESATGTPSWSGGLFVRVPELCPWIGVAGLVATSVLFDRLAATGAMTFHDPRPPVLAVVALGLGLIAWRRRHHLPMAGRVGVVVCMAGAAANLVCLVMDSDGVSDYLHVEVRGLLLAFNIADVMLLVGVSIVFASVAAPRVARRIGLTS